MLDLLVYGLFACAAFPVLANLVLPLLIQVSQFVVWIVINLSISWTLVPLSILMEKSFTLLIYILSTAILVTYSILVLTFKFVLVILSMVFGLVGQILSLTALSSSNHNHNLRPRSLRPGHGNGGNQRPVEAAAEPRYQYGQGPPELFPPILEQSVTPPASSPTPSAPSFTMLNNNTPTKVPAASIAAVNNLNDDCKDYFAGHCIKGSACDRRHSEAALGSTVQCPDWANGYCELWSLCPNRHALTKDIQVIKAKLRLRNQNPTTSSPSAPQDQNRNNISATAPRPPPGFQNHSSSSSKGVRRVDHANDVNSIECPICLEDFSEIKRCGKLLSSLECGHVLCKDCAESRIIKTEKLCPTCRTPITQKPRVIYI